MINGWSIHGWSIDDWWMMMGDDGSCWMKPGKISRSKPLEWSYGVPLSRSSSELWSLHSKTCKKTRAGRSRRVAQVGVEPLSEVGGGACFSEKSIFLQEVTLKRKIAKANQTPVAVRSFRDLFPICLGFFLGCGWNVFSNVFGISFARRCNFFSDITLWRFLISIRVCVLSQICAIHVGGWDWYNGCEKRGQGAWKQRPLWIGLLWYGLRRSRNRLDERQDSEQKKRWSHSWRARWNRNNENKGRRDQWSMGRRKLGP